MGNSKIPIEVQGLYLNHCSLLDVHLYTSGTALGYFASSQAKTRVEGLVHIYFQPTEVASFWKFLSRTQAAITANSSRAVLLPWTEHGRLTIAVPSIGGGAWRTFLVDMGWVEHTEPYPPDFNKIINDNEPITLRSDYFPDAASSPDDDVEPTQGWSGVNCTKYFFRNGVHIAILVSDTIRAIDAIITCDFTSELSFITETTITCLHPRMLKAGISMFRRSRVENYLFRREMRQGLSVAMDARDVEDTKLASLVPCRAALFEWNRQSPHIWSVIWQHDRKERNLMEEGMVWRNGFTCRSLACLDHSV